MSFDNTTRRDRLQSAWPGVHENVRREVQELSEKGVAARLVNPSLEGHYLLDRDTQLRVNDAIDSWSSIPDFSDTMFAELSPGARAWAGLSKRAIALHAFYNTGELDSPSRGIDPQSMNWELFDGKSARQLLVEESPDKSAKILAKYDAFFRDDSMRVGEDRFGLTAHDYLAGAVDRIADITRANAASDIILQDVADREELYRKKGVTMASFGSGLAEPDFWIAKNLTDAGIPVDAIHMFDNDPFALAAAVSRAKVNGVDDIVQLHRKNFIKHSPSDYLERGSVDYANLIGVFEYIPRDVHGYHMAGNLLKQVSSVVRPGGMIVFGNMVKDRAQQKWFEGIWPTLLQRQISEVIAIVEEAGFSQNDLEAVVTEGEGIYGVYALRMPESNDKISKIAPLQKALGRLVLHRMPEY